MNTESDKIELKSLKELRDFHQSEARKFQGLIDEHNKVKNEKKVVDRTAGYNLIRAKYIKECDVVYDILRRENTGVGTGKLCEFLNSRLDYPRLYNSSEFGMTLGKYLKDDSRIKSEFGHINGKRTLIWSLIK